MPSPPQLQIELTCNIQDKHTKLNQKQHMHLQLFIHKLSSTHGRTMSADSTEQSSLRGAAEPEEVDPMDEDAAGIVPAIMAEDQNTFTHQHLTPLTAV